MVALWSLKIFKGSPRSQLVQLRSSALRMVASLIVLCTQTRFMGKGVLGKRTQPSAFGAVGGMLSVTGSFMRIIVCVGNLLISCLIEVFHAEKC